jgi:hypothetical protein
VQIIPALGVVLLAGCSSHTAWQVSAGTPLANPTVQIEAGHTFATFVGLTILSLGAYEASRGGVHYLEPGSRRAPEMAPDRKVNEVDCTQPIDYSLGNIRCK